MEDLIQEVKADPEWAAAMIKRGLVAIETQARFGLDVAYTGIQATMEEHPEVAQQWRNVIMCCVIDAIPGHVATQEERMRWGVDAANRTIKQMFNVEVG